MSGDGLRQKNALYEAYIKLIPTVISIHSAIELMASPVHKEALRRQRPCCGQCTQYAHLDDKVTFCGKTIASKVSKKKDVESAYFQQLLKHVMNGGIAQYK